MSDGQIHEIPTGVRGPEEPSMGLDIICSWLTDNDQQEFCDYITEYCTDQAALLWSCCKLLRWIVQEPQAEEKHLALAKLLADTLYKACKDAVRTSPDGYVRREMNERANTIVQKMQEEVDSHMKKYDAAARLKRQEEEDAAQLKKQEEEYDSQLKMQAAGGRHDDTEEQDTVAALKAQLKKQEEEHAAQLKIQATGGRHDDAGERDTVAALKAQLKAQEEEHAAQLKKQEKESAASTKTQEERYAAQLKQQEEEYNSQLKMQAAGGRHDDTEEQDTVAALKAQLKKQEEEHTAQLKKNKKEADTKLKDRVGIEEDLNLEIRALQERSNAPDAASSRHARCEASAQDIEEKLRKEIAQMQNLIDTLNAQLKAATYDALASSGTDGKVVPEENSGEYTPATDDGSDDEEQVEGGGDELFAAEGVESTVGHTDIPDDDEAEISHSPSGVTADEDGRAAAAAAALVAGDTAVEEVDLRERKKIAIDKIVPRLQVEVAKFGSGAQDSFPRNLVAVTFPSLLESVVESSVHWARGEAPIEDILRIATDLFDLVELNQEVNEQTELQMSASNRRIRRGCLGAMMHALNESIGEEDAQNGEELVEAGKRAVTDLRKIGTVNWTCDTVAKLAESTKLGECGRSILNSVLHLVAVVEALRKKEVSTIAEFGSQAKNRSTMDKKKADRAALKAAFADFCPGDAWDDCRASVLVSAMMKFLAGNNLDERRKQRAIAAMAIIFDKRMVLDDELWAHVDAFSLNGESSEQKFFTVTGRSANRRRYSALHYMLTFCLGNHIDEAIEATDEDSDVFKWIRSDEKSFQQLFLLCSVDRIRQHITDKPAAKSHLFGIGGRVLDDVALNDGIITNGEAIGSIRALLNLARARQEGKKKKSGEYSKVPFGADRSILLDLDVLSIAESFDAAAELIERTYDHTLDGKKGKKDKY